MDLPSHGVFLISLNHRVINTWLAVSCNNHLQVDTFDRKERSAVDCICYVIVGFKLCQEMPLHKTIPLRICKGS